MAIRGKENPTQRKVRMEREKKRKAAAAKRRKERIAAGKPVIGGSIDRNKKSKGYIGTAVGKVRDKLTGVKKTVKTEGGDYKVYKKGSKKATSFRAAYAASTGQTFTWQGRKYKSKGADKPKPASKPGAPPRKFDSKKPLVKSNTSTIKTKLGPTKPRKKKNFVGQVLKDNILKGTTKEDLKKIREKQKNKPKTKYDLVAEADERARKERLARKNKRKK